MAIIFIRHTLCIHEHIDWSTLHLQRTSLYCVHPLCMTVSPPPTPNIRFGRHQRSLLHELLRTTIPYINTLTVMLSIVRPMLPIKIGPEPSRAVPFFPYLSSSFSPNASIHTHLAAGRTRSARCRPLPASARCRPLLSARCRPLLELQDVGCSALAVTGGRAAPARSPVTRWGELLPARGVWAVVMTGAALSWPAAGEAARWVAGRRSPAPTPPVSLGGAPPTCCCSMVCAPWRSSWRSDGGLGTRATRRHDVW
jgi:hypothetical protein